MNFVSEKKALWKIENGRCGDKNDCFCGKMSDFSELKVFENYVLKKTRDKKPGNN